MNVHLMRNPLAGTDSLIDPMLNQWVSFFTSVSGDSTQPLYAPSRCGYCGRKDVVETIRGARECAGCGAER